ncbi:DUF1002 domain-containing protein [Levilactobacillus bambusae]|uniref:DUF1002 domain-containing protein n=1 Tax=Levilactobacillus bambusae TaxID=2024736 RepID=A0A2V1N0R3_9LACO|nr:DUF1002 domain-containing protein [Levilactobacillus bambusae]PWG00662.1 DUF1002 domain-containing protein [Levilactobacillus bambusae]
MTKKFIIPVIAIALLTGGSMAATSNRALADDQASDSSVMTSSESQSSSDTTQTKALSKAYVVYGTGLASEDKAKVADALGVKSNYTALTVDGDDYAKYLNANGTSNASMISCVSLAPADPGSGVKVNIVNYDGQDNITKVTSQQYAMVATMAGVKDVIITVTADKAVSGESALTGVYKALANDGLTMDAENTKAANGVLDATQSAIDQNSDDKSYPGKLMSAVGDVSSQLAEDRQSSGQTTSNTQIEVMLRAALKKEGIESQTSNTTINNIVISLKNVQNSPVSLSKNYVKNASNVANNLKDSVGDKMASLKDYANSADAKKAENWFASIWDRIVDFFQGLFYWLMVSLVASTGL